MLTMEILTDKLQNLRMTGEAGGKQGVRSATELLVCSSSNDFRSSEDADSISSANSTQSYISEVEMRKADNDFHPEAASAGKEEEQEQEEQEQEESEEQNVNVAGNYNRGKENHQRQEELRGPDESGRKWRKENTRGQAASPTVLPTSYVHHQSPPAIYFPTHEVSPPLSQLKTCVFVGNLPYAALTENELFSIFSPFGTITGIRMIPNGIFTEQCAYVVFDNPISAEKSATYFNSLSIYSSSANVSEVPLFLKPEPVPVIGCQPMQVQVPYINHQQPFVVNHPQPTYMSVSPHVIAVPAVNMMPQMVLSPRAMPTYYGSPQMHYSCQTSHREEIEQKQYTDIYSDLDYCKLYISGLPVHCTKEYLFMLFSCYGNVVDVIIFPGNLNGYASGFVKLSTPDEAQNALNALNQRYVMRGSNGPISVSIAASRTASSSCKGKEMVKLFVGSLPFSTINLHLYRLFQRVGNVLEVCILRDNSGKSKGCGFVKFKTRAEADAAISQLNGSTELDGIRPIKISYATKTSTEQ